MRLAVALMALLLAEPASAETPLPTVSEEAEHALKCAMWAAMIAGSEEADAEARQSLGFSLSYWIGRFEGLTGQHFDEVATVGFLEGVSGELEALAPVCGPEMEAVGSRMVGWGERMQSVGQ